MLYCDVLSFTFIDVVILVVVMLHPCSPPPPSNPYPYLNLVVMLCITTGIFRDKTMADKLKYIPNDDTHNYPFVDLLSG